MLDITCTIAGKTPLIMHRYSDDELVTSSDASKPVNRFTTASPREQAERRIYYGGADGKTVILPQSNLMRCITEAGKFFKIGKSKITTAKSSILPGILEWDDVEFPIEFDTWEVDIRGVVNPTTQGRRLCYRPIFPTWSLTFCVRLDETELHPDILRDLVDAAGRKIGLGSMRPERKGPYGRFRVTRWEENEADLEAQTPVVVVRGQKPKVVKKKAA
jgi:hypothetical protein